MRLLKRLLRFLVSRRLWTFVGVLVLCWLVWAFGPLVAVGEVEPLASEVARLIAIGAILFLWLLSVLLGQLRAARANRAFVAELAKAPPQAAHDPTGEVAAKFRTVLEDLRRGKGGSRRLLSEMPWYLLIGPPGTGKTTALRQSGLDFPMDLSDDLKGVGGTRNCDWFFTNDAVLLDTAGRYTEQASAPEADAAEWRGFLDLLKRHRGRRSLNGVVVAISLRELLGPTEALRLHARAVRRRLAELREGLAIHLPTYLLVTKLDLLPGFETFFADLSTSEREQVWGWTLRTDAPADGAGVERELRDLAGRAERRLDGRLAEDLSLRERAEAFRFPAQLLRLEAPLRSFVEGVFGETRYDEAAWLRGVYLTSATQEGTPIDRLVGELAGAYGLSAEPPVASRRGERRSFFLRRLLTDVVFKEAGLGVLDPAREDRRRWAWRGAVAACVLVAALLSALFAFSYVRGAAALSLQARQFEALAASLAPVAARQAPTDPLDLAEAVAAVQQVEAALVPAPATPLDLLGPRADRELLRAQDIAEGRALDRILLPRMVAMLEAAMWRRVRDPDQLLGALKAYHMLTGLAAYDEAFVSEWWQASLPAAAEPFDPFPSEEALRMQLDALARFPGEAPPPAPDPELLAAALETVCGIPIETRAYQALLSHPAVTALPEWIPAESAGPNGGTVLTRLTGKTLRAGLPGAFTYRGFRDAVLPLVPEVAAQAALDGLVVAGSCEETQGSDATALAAEIEPRLLDLYAQDFIATWDGFLRDVRLAPLADLTVATANLKDLASPASALTGLLTEVAAQTDLARPEAAEEGGAAVPDGVVRAATKRLGTLGRLIGRADAAAGQGGEEAPAVPAAARAVSDHFAPIRGLVAEVDGAPAGLADTRAALGALANELQTVQNTPDPEAALLARGGLPELTGAVAEVARGLPDPIDDWIGGIAADTTAVTREAVVAQLTARVRADVLPLCRAATGGRYPFDRASRIDVTLADFRSLFGPGGKFEAFTDEQLLPYVDTAARPWAWRSDLGLPPGSLVPFERARAIRDALFPGGTGPLISFRLQPTDLSPNAARVTLNIDGQLIIYFNNPTQPAPVTWPGPDQSGFVAFGFTPTDGGAEAVSTPDPGDWALLHLLDQGDLVATDQSNLFRLTLSVGPYRASFDLLADSVENPFDLSMFAGFSCPESF